MNQLSTERRAQVIRCLVDGNSVRATCRITGTAKGTVLRLGKDVGRACAEYQDKTLRNLPCEKIQCDEIWSFVHTRGDNLPRDGSAEKEHGDIWTFTAICADTKIVPCWLLGRRDFATARVFIQDLKDRLANRVQLTTDGHHAYLKAVDATFKGDVDYAELHKLYKERVDKRTGRRSTECIGASKQKRRGNPDMKDVSTSYVERQNPTMRMSMRRYTRKTNAFSKKMENLACAVALHFMYYNFCRIHQTLRVTPAMEAGVADHVWEIEGVVGLLGKTPR